MNARVGSPGTGEGKGCGAPSLHTRIFAHTLFRSGCAHSPPPSESHPSFKGPLRFYLLQAVSPNYSSPLVPPSLDKLTLTT